MKNLKDILDQKNQSIDVNKKLQSTGTLLTTFRKHTGAEDLYVQFGYNPQKIYNHTQEQVSGSMNTDLIITDKQVNNQQ